jgi:hypothetical protein
VTICSPLGPTNPVTRPSADLIRPKIFESCKSETNFFLRERGIQVPALAIQSYTAMSPLSPAISARISTRAVLRSSQCVPQQHHAGISPTATNGASRQVSPLKVSRCMHSSSAFDPRNPRPHRIRNEFTQIVPVPTLPTNPRTTSTAPVQPMPRK